MTIEEAKSIRIADYLHSLGYSPVKQQGINLWYKSPFREESEASFKVNTEREQWYDFGLGKGGNIIALAAHLYATDHVPYILKRIAEQTPHVRPISFSFGKQSSSEPSFQHLEIVPLSSPALLAYLQGRGINTELAKRECSEARFTHNGKRYFAIAFPNGSGGFEVRNRYFKGCIAPKEISHIRQSGKARNTCYVFEGFMDYLSFLTLRQESCPNYPELDGQDYIVLNSVSNVNKALYPLGNYERIHCFFDNDRAGMEALQQIRKEYGRDRYIRDASQTYSGCKDLNEHLQKQVESFPGKRHHDDGGGKGGARTLRAAAEPIHRTRRARAEGRRGAAVHPAHLHADAGCYGRHDAGVGGKPCVRKSCRRCSRSTSSSASKIRRRKCGGGRRLSPAARRLGSTSPSGRT